jgi:hypothetical protein
MTVAGARTLYQGWEETSLDIAGPRVGKTTARVIPPILQAPGAVVATSNKRDVVDATRGPRSRGRAGVGVRPAGTGGRAPELVVEPAELRDR